MLAPCVPGDWDRPYEACEHLLNAVDKGGRKKCCFDAAEGMALAADSAENCGSKTEASSAKLTLLRKTGGLRPFNSGDRPVSADSPLKNFTVRLSPDRSRLRLASLRDQWGFRSISDLAAADSHRRAKCPYRAPNPSSRRLLRVRSVTGSRIRLDLTEDNHMNKG